MNSGDAATLLWMIVWTVCDTELCVTRIGPERFAALAACESWLDENFPDNGEDVTAYCASDPATRPPENGEESIEEGEDGQPAPG